MKQIVTFLLLFSVVVVKAQETIEHVEPPPWWGGMEHGKFEI